MLNDQIVIPIQIMRLQNQDNTCTSMILTRSLQPRSSSQSIQETRYIYINKFLLMFLQMSIFAMEAGYNRYKFIYLKKYLQQKSIVPAQVGMELNWYCFNKWQF